MRRLLELSASTLRTGEARSPHDDKGGTWVAALGLNAFISDDAYRFLLATTAAPTQLGADQITDVPVAYALRRRSAAAGGNLLYILGSTGRFYKVTTAGTVTVIRPQTTLTAIATAVGGMETFVDSGGNEYLLIAGFDTLVRWNFDEGDSATHWNASTGLQGAFVHPFHRLFDSIYLGNGPYIARIPLDALHNQSGALSNIELTKVLIGNAVETFHVSAAGDDGRYLIAGVSHRFDDTDEASSPHTHEAKVAWYSGTSGNWEWETTLKGERAVRAIVRNALGVYAIGEQTIYKIGFGMTPQLVKTFAAADKISLDASTSPFRFGRVNLAAPFGDAMIFGKRGTVYGKRFPSEPITSTHPLPPLDADFSMLAPDVEKGKIIVGTEDGKLFKFDMATAGNSEIGYPTRWFDLKGDYALERLDVELPAGIGETDVQTVRVEVPSGEYIDLVISRDTLEGKHRYFAQLDINPNLEGSKVRFTLTQSAGSPRLGGMYLYGGTKAN